MSFLVAPPPPPPPPVVVVVDVVVVVARHALFEQPFVQVLEVHVPALQVCRLLPSHAVPPSSYAMPLNTHCVDAAQYFPVSKLFLQVALQSVSVLHGEPWVSSAPAP